MRARAKYRTGLDRLMAAMIDAVVLFPVALLDGWIESELEGLAWALWMPASLFVYGGYGVWLHAKYGQTLGKWVMRVKVLDVSEKRLPSLGQALMRAGGYLAVVAMVSAYYYGYLIWSDAPQEELRFAGSTMALAGVAWSGVEMVSLWFNAKRRAAHDWIAGTVVVKSFL